MVKNIFVIGVGLLFGPAAFWGPSAWGLGTNHSKPDYEVVFELMDSAVGWQRDLEAELSVAQFERMTAEVRKVPYLHVEMTAVSDNTDVVEMAIVKVDDGICYRFGKFRKRFYEIESKSWTIKMPRDTIQYSGVWMLDQRHGYTEFHFDDRGKDPDNRCVTEVEIHYG